MLVTELGIVTEVRLLQPKNANSPILLTDSGMVTEVRLLHSENANSPILITDSGILYGEPALAVG